jgi:hypothetical protein
MALSRDHLESIIWPKYKEAGLELCREVWMVANPKQANVASPSWFNEIVELQLKSIIMLVFATPQSWVVLPEPIPGFTMVVFKKPQGATLESPQQKLSLRNHTFNQFSELSQLVEKATVKLVKNVVGAGAGDVVELENEDGHVFIFPRSKMQQYLKALGFDESQMPKLLSIDDIETDFGLE